VTAAWQRKAQRELAAQLRAKDRARLAQLRAELAGAKLARAARIRAIKGGARVELARAREKFAELLGNLRAALKSARAVRRYIAPGARALGGVQLARGAAEGAAIVAHAVGALDRERHEQADIRRSLRRGAKRPTLASVREKHGESTESVRTDLPPELRPVWDRMQRHIKATPRASRLEMFLHWVHDNSQDVERIQNEVLAADVGKLEREARELERSMRSPQRYRRTAGALAAEVPF
jgi:hypothetical protein